MHPCLKVSTTTIFKISIKNQTFILLSGEKCEKLAKNVRNCYIGCFSISFSEKISQLASTLAEKSVLKKWLQS